MPQKRMNYAICVSATEVYLQSLVNNEDFLFYCTLQITRGKGEESDVSFALTMV